MWLRGTVGLVSELESHKCQLCGDTATHRGITPDAKPLYYCPQHAEKARAALDAMKPTEEQKRIRPEAADHKCTICGGVATNWVAMRDREWYFCDRHEAWGQYVLSDHLCRRPAYYEEEP